MNAHCAFENTGSYKEVIFGGMFIFPDKGTNEYSTIMRKGSENKLPELMGPFILKPQQIELKHFNWHIES